MPLLNKKQQILAAIETSEGTAVTLSASDATEVFNPQIQTTVDVQERAPASASLSSSTAAVGRKQRSLTFEADFKGSGSTGTAPPWAKYVQGSGFRLTTTVRLLTLGAVTGIGFQAGEIVQQTSTNRGVVLCILDASNNPKHRTTTTGDKLVVAVLTGTLGTAATTGESSASTSTPSAAANATAWSYQHTSEKLVTLQVASWTGGAPAVGDVLRVENVTTSELIATCQVIRDNGSMLSFEVTLLHGQPGFNATFAQNRLRTPANGTAVLSAAPAQSRGQSLTIGHNLDGRSRPILGARGTFTLEGDAGGPMQFKYSFTGDAGTDADALQVTTTGLSSVSVPRLLGAWVLFGNGVESYRLPTKRVSYDNGGQVIANADANRAGGSTGGIISDRAPSLTFTVDNVNGAFDWEGALAAGTPIRVAVIAGTTQGNIMCIVAPIAQVTECPIGNADNVSTFDVTLRARRVLESGDDELFLVQV